LQSCLIDATELGSRFRVGRTATSYLFFFFFSFFFTLPLPLPLPLPQTTKRHTTRRRRCKDRVSFNQRPKSEFKIKFALTY
jgi:hypothetical protein